MRFKRVVGVVSFGVLAFARVQSAQASEPNAQRVHHFSGAVGESVPIQVPPFHGIEPRLALSYSSEARNGFAGMGWNLAGFSTIERSNSALGAPAYTGGDVFMLDGQPILPCPPGSTYPSCAAGGNYYTQQESYLRVKKVSDSLWEVTGKDGTKTEFSPTFTPSGLTPMRYGQTKVTDTDGNVVNYNWAVDVGGIVGNTYPSSITYQASTGYGYRIDFFREARPDALTRGAYNLMGKQMERLKSVVVSLATNGVAGARIRAYKLTYATSAATGKSLLSSVQMYGTDAVVDGTGSITGGTTLPAQTFGYTTDASASTFGSDAQIGSASPPPTAPGTVENVVWAYTEMAVGDGSTIQVDGTVDGYDPNVEKWAYSARGISSGTGYAEYDFTGGAAYFYFGPALVYQTSYGAFFTYVGGAYVGGPYYPSAGSKIRVEVAPASVTFKVNGASLGSYGASTAYPVGISAVLYAGGDQFANVRVSGALVDRFAVGCVVQTWYGDFNGDGRQDTVCTAGGYNIRVNLASANGFSGASIWGWSGNYISGVGDFNNDGKDDIVMYNSFWGKTYVGLSTGSSFGAITYWGGIIGYDWAGYEYACRMNGATFGRVGDWNGDGKADISCYDPTDPYAKQFVGISTGNYFYTAIWSTTGPCPVAFANLPPQGTVDFDADGRDDWSCRTANADILGLTSLGYTFYFGISLNGFCSAGEFSFGDWNGDGTTDAACANNGRVALSSGGIFADQGTSTGFCVSGQRLSADLDGDGAAEWICNNPGTPANDIEVRRWTGTTFGAPTTWRGSFCASEIRSADFNGDGKKDLLCEGSGLVAYAGTKNTKPDLLASMTNGIGGTAALTYQTTITHIDATPTWRQPNEAKKGLPVKYLLTSQVASDGRQPISPTSTTSYTYVSGAPTDDSERKFFGFAEVWEHLPALPGETGTPPSVYRKFRTDKNGPGLPEQVTKYDGQSRVLSTETFTYTIPETTPRRVIQQTQRAYFQWTGMSTLSEYTAANPGNVYPNTMVARRQWDTSYDNYGNVTQVVDSGNLDASGDETTTVYLYAPNPTAYIVGIPGAVNTYQGTTSSGTPILTSNYSGFDGAAIWTTPPTKGHRTSNYAWIKEESRYVASTAAFDATGNPLTSVDPTGRSSTTAWDANYKLFPIESYPTADATLKTTTVWDPKCGVPTSVTNPNGQVTTTTLDPLCRPLTTTAPLGAFETRSYLQLGDPANQRVRVETPGPDGTNSWSETFFDGFGRTYKGWSRGPSVSQSIVSETLFNARGNVAQQTAPYYANGTAKITTYAYDRFDRPTVTTFPDGTVSTNVYENMDPSDYLFKSKTTIARKLTAGGSPQTTSSVSKSNILGQVKKTETITGAGAGATTLVTSTRTYDILGRMVSMQDAASNTWTYTFDSLGRTLAKNDPDAGNWTYKYDDASRLLWQKDAKNQYTTFEYDALGRPTNKKLRPTGGDTGPVTENTETTYGTTPAQFDRGQVTQVVTKTGAGTELSGKTTFGYDALGRVKTQTKYIDGTAYTVNRNFDSAGYLRGIQYPDGDVIGQYNGSGTPLGYDQAGRLTSIPGILNSVTYNALGSPLVQTNANGTTTTKTYDSNRFWLTNISTITPSVTVQNLSYTLNEVGMALQVGSPIANEQWTYEYDSLGRLITSTNGVPANSQSWTYNNIGNILTNVGATTNTYAYGGPRPHAVTNISGGSFGNLSFTYDANGNMETGNGRSIAWRPDNLPSSVTMTATSTTTSFMYDPFGERVKKTTGATSTVYPFGDDYEINAGVVTKYVNAGFGVIAKKVGATTYWIHTDRLGSINATTDNTGAEVLRRTYRAYGDLLGQTGTNAESRGYIDQRQDSETGLTYLHARLYDSKLGVFVSPDPLNPSQPFVYGFGDAVNFADRDGLDPCGVGGSNTSSFAGGPVVTHYNQPLIPCNRTRQVDVAGLASFAFFGYCVATNCLFDPLSEEIERQIRNPRDRGNDVIDPCKGKKPCGGDGKDDGKDDGKNTGSNTGNGSGNKKDDSKKEEKKGTPTSPECRNGPDYVTFSVSGLRIATGALTIDRYGNSYLSLGVGIGVSPGASASVLGGELLRGGSEYRTRRGIEQRDSSRQHTRGDPATLGSFLTGFAANASAGFGPAVGAQTSGGRNSLETGISTPQAGIAASYGWQIGSTPVSWGACKP